MRCAHCNNDQPWGGDLCQGCYWRFRNDISDLGFAYDWLKLCMVKWPQADTGDHVSGTREPPAPLRVQLLDQAIVIHKLLQQIVRDLGIVPNTVPAKNVATIDKHFDHLVSHKAVAAMIQAVRRVKKTAHRLSPWRREYRNLGVPCPGCDLLTLRLYSGDSWVTCRNPECTEIAMPWYRYEKWVKTLAIRHGVGV